MYYQKTKYLINATIVILLVSIFAIFTNLFTAKYNKNEVNKTINYENQNDKNQSSYNYIPHNHAQNLNYQENLPQYMNNNENSEQKSNLDYNENTPQYTDDEYYQTKKEIQEDNIYED